MTEGRTALFGGTFNPIHYGHLRAAEEVREVLGLRRVVFVPSCFPPLKSEDLAEAAHRLEMTRMAVEGNPFFEVSDMECRRGGRSYTVDTLEELKRASPSSEPLFILGVDAFLDMPNWHRPERLMELCDFVVVNRPPHRIEELSRSPYLREAGRSGLMHLSSGRWVLGLNCTPIAISASDIRWRLRNNLSIRYLLPESVESYIISNRLYIPKTPTGDR